MRSRWPRRRRPWLRVMLVLAQVSSMKISRSGSRSGWASNQASRRFRTSGRSCSPACPVFFARGPVAEEEAADRAVAETMAPLRQRRAEFCDGRVRRCLPELEVRRGLCFDAPGAAIAALRLWRRVALNARQAPPSAHARCADAKPRGRLAMARACGDRRKRPAPKVERKGFRHARRPPSRRKG